LTYGCPLLTLCICYGCLHYLPYYRRPLELQAAPALLWAPPKTAACTRLRRLHHYPARAPCLPHLPPAMRSTTITTTTTVLNQHPMALSNRMPMLYAICRYSYAFMRIWLKAALKPAPNCMRHHPTIILYHHPQPYAVVQSYPK
jgi:hypothetical protein